MGSAAYEALPDTTQTRRYVLAAGESSRGATLRRLADPVYPATLLARNLPPVRIVVRLVIGINGRVQRLLPHPAMQLESVPYAQDFMAAIAECTAQWHFAPLVITRVVIANGKTTRTLRDLPFSLDYAFRFEVHDGRPATGLSRQ